MSIRLKSHPDLYLSEHIEQVISAFQGIFCWHSSKTINESVIQVLSKLARVHDLGKGTPFFQKYISDPMHYSGDLMEKSHTPLSLVLLLTLAQKEKWGNLDVLTIGACASGHHSRLPTLPSKSAFEDTSLTNIDRFSSGLIANILKKQLGSLSYDLLQEETQARLTDVDLLTDSSDKPNSIINSTKRYLLKQIMPAFYQLNEPESIIFRLKTQLIFSILLEADKAFLAVSNPDIYLKRDVRVWKSSWVDEQIGKPDDSETNRLRAQARHEVLHTINQYGSSDSKIFSLTAPTGCGKTMLAATWALSMRERATSGITPKIIVVLPYLSVIDQSAKVYSELLKTGKVDADGCWLLVSHSLSDRHFADCLEQNEQSFFIDSWRSELIITTYDQFLMSLMDPKARYQMRFHNLCDALIIMDEVQSLPCKLWQPLDKIIHSLAETGNSNFLLMSATLPSFVGQTKPLIEDYEEYFKRFTRYKICLRLGEAKSDIDSFCEEMIDRLPNWLKSKKRVLITLNTRAGARKVRDALYGSWPENKQDIPLLFISADITPRDRLNTIDKIKCGKPCIVVSTQCIEAGVDIDMDIVIRDFAPLDSLIQISGRCHREGRSSGERGIVEIVDLDDGTDIEKKNRYSEMVYDLTHLQVTRRLLEEKSEILEEEVLMLSNRFFEQLLKEKDTGNIHVKRFAQWQDDVEVHELLRGKERKQYEFLVIQQDLLLKNEIAKVCSIEDRWQRREGWRKIASRIALATVTIYAKPRFRPESIADEYGGLYLLKDGYYSSERGLCVEGGIDIW